VVPFAVSLTNPIWLLVLAAIPLLIGLQLIATRRRSRYAVRFPALGTLAAIAPRGASWRRWLPVALILAAFIPLSVAMAKPQRTVSVPIEKASVILVTDTSNSMIAEDVDPDRLTAAKNAANTFISELPDGLELGGVAYSTGPYDVIAPTDDHGEVKNMIDSLQPDGATATGDALQAALDSLSKEKGSDGKPAPAAIILLSDGQTTAGRDPIGVAENAKKQHVPIYTVALGTPSGTIPGPGGSSVPVPPDPVTLKRIADITGGQSFTVDDADALNGVYAKLGSRIGSKKETREMTAGFATIGAILLAAGLLAAVRFGPRFP
jgi:Ca-activated chloride channel family protein